MATTDNYNIIEVVPAEHILPSFEVFGTKVVIPTSSLNTVLLTLLIIIKIQEVIKSGTNGLKIAMTALDRTDIVIIDAMDDLAVEMREITNADRVIFLLLHNGISNHVYHWKRLSAMSECTRVGIKPILKEMRDLLIPSIVTESDYKLYKKLKVDSQFIHIHVENAVISRKHKNFIVNTGMYGQYLRVLVDEDIKKPYGVLLIQYASPEQFNITWSQETYDALETKLDVLYSLFAKRIESDRFRFLARCKEFMRFGK